MTAGPPAKTALGARVEPGGVRFSVWAQAARAIWVSVFDEAGDREVARHALERGEDGVYSALVPGLREGARYGLRADGEYDPASGLWFDPEKLLVDPYAMEIDRPYRHDPRLASARGSGDTAALVPKAIVRESGPPLPRATPLWRPGGLVYEVAVRGFTMRHPEIPEAERGTLRALGRPAVLDHLERIGVTAVELMPVTAWIDERHLPALGLSNAWGYNSVTFMALDPRLAPGGLADLRRAVEALHERGIGVILDVVFNHTGESDAQGTTLSLRGLDARAYFRHDDRGRLVNDTGTGNTLACGHPAVQRLVLDAMSHFVRHAGVDGFRFDLAPVLGRTERGFDPQAPLLQAIAADETLSDRVLIAEPWDIGPGGYQLGSFPKPFLEWNDRFRDDVRCFWRGDEGRAGALATRLAGSSDIFSGSATRSVNFVAAHDGMTLADMVSYEHKHNFANGEDNRDGHNENLSWNNGVEGPADDPQIIANRRRDVMALLSTLFSSRGAIMLTAGDEFGRSQAGNNNAYAQDNETTWLDWEGRDRALEEHVADLSRLRRETGLLENSDFLRAPGSGGTQVAWLREDGHPLDPADWEDGTRRRFAMVLRRDGEALAVLFNGSHEEALFLLPGGDTKWKPSVGEGRWRDCGFGQPPRSVAFLKGIDA